MKKQMILGWLFFSAVWGLSEVLLGGSLFGYKIPYASIPLVVIGFLVLSLARVFFPYLGMATLIAVGALFFKFLNAPFYKCHYLGILVTGISFDLFFAVLALKRRWLAAAAAAWFNNLAFAVLMTYVIHYQPWVQNHPEKFLYHVLISGSVIAVLSAFLVPLCLRQAESLRQKYPAPFQWQPGLAARMIPLASTLCWAGSLVIFGYQVL
ncbi:MAG: hypothetical protein BWY71_01319 [Planctomycetes bacterium ADurb.Bin412]|mgnify:FL=1|nr:MAG: hypothetical protein BWY71_01319 [Planctomycetes bacterium ADurb.Bin412]